MILVDGAHGSIELKGIIPRHGIACESAHLPFADACFEGNGPEGVVGIGVERKRLSDMLACVTDARYTGHQRVGMSKMYAFSLLVIEGLWKPDTRSGILLWGYEKPDYKVVWTQNPPDGGRPVMYRTLRRYLFSVQFSSSRVIILFSRDIAHTAFEIVELYHWFQKRWQDHKSMLAMHAGYHMGGNTWGKDYASIPTLMGEPNLVRKWAAQLDGVGVVKSADAARIFRTPRLLANSDEMDWLKIPNVGVETAQRIIRQIGGR